MCSLVADTSLTHSCSTTGASQQLDTSLKKHANQGSPSGIHLGLLQLQTKRLSTQRQRVCAGICPKAQFFAALIGSLASCGISTAAYALFSSVYEIGGDKLPAPTAKIWLDMARLMTGGRLPEHVLGYCWGGAVLGVVMALLPEVLAALESNSRLSPAAKAAVAAATQVTPSGIGFAVGMYISPEFVLPRVIGGLLSIPAVWSWVAPTEHHGNMLITASGLVLGEGICSMLVTIVKSLLL